MITYACVKDNLVTNIVVADSSFVADKPEYIECPSGVGIGYSYSNGSFTAPPTPEVLEIVVTNMACTNPAAIIKSDFSSILCNPGDQVTVMMEMRKDGTLLPISDFFKTPVIASDGREIFFITNFVSGVCTLVKNAPDPGYWAISEYGINKYNTTGIVFKFKGLEINVED